jgi:protein-tyrosine phosphatase
MFVWARRAVVGFLLFMVVGNLAILVPSLVLQHFAGPSAPAAATSVSDVEHLAAVDTKVWRGAAPGSREGYRSLAAAGVTTVVDLRTETDRPVDDTMLRSFGLRIVSLPIRDGQTPTRAQTDEFQRVVAASSGKVFLHCGAGVGRTGSVAAAYLVATGQASGVRATLRNLSVGPPSLEQIAFTSRFQRHGGKNANVVVVAASRMLDAPRRIWTRLG